jgi:aryl-alcohol dehydrogenase-like predicted oxidoreductase
MTTSLPTVRLGWTDMLLTRVGFGAWAIGGGGWAYAWGDQDDAESIAARWSPGSTGSTPPRCTGWGIPRR